MIYFICPQCGQAVSSVGSEIIISLLGRVGYRVHPITRKLTLGVIPPLRYNENIRCILSAECTCPSCHQVSPQEEWSINICCGNCSQVIADAHSVEGAQMVVDQHFCIEFGTVLCSKCWANIREPYCTQCRDQGTCMLYQIQSEEVENAN